jgi:hypothetical protein
MARTKLRPLDLLQSLTGWPDSWLLIVLLMGLMFAGCGGTAAELVEAPKLDQPESYEDAGKTWTLKPDMETTDEEALTKFFEIHSHFQGSTDFEGPPTMYLSGTTDRRYYWVRGTTEETVWSCVHFEGGDFAVTEGTGNPFAR